MKHVLKLSIVALSLLASGCHVPYDDSYEVDRTPYIRYFTLIPAAGARAWNYGADPITPYLNDGEFELRWELEAYGQTHIDLYVSNDTWLGPDDAWGREDLLFKHIGGGNSHGDDYHVDTVYMGCRFSTDNILSCGAISYDNPGRDITPFLSQLPKTGYLILRACDELTGYCATASRFVEFQ